MKKSFLTMIILATATMFVACTNDLNDGVEGGTTSQLPAEMPAWYHTGGELGTAYVLTSHALEQPTGQIVSEGMYESFKSGEALFENEFMTNTSGTRHGLGPVYIRTSCLHCHPGYGHGKRIEAGSFEADEVGNGCLLVVYNKDTEGYVSWVAGMPQGYAVAPFKAPVDHKKVIVSWHDYTDEWGNKFDDGETYSLQYPTVHMCKDAIYAYNQGELSDADLGNYGVKLESTIGIYGTGLLDAISDEDLTAEWAKQEQDGYMKHGINNAFFAGGQWVNPYKSTAVNSNGQSYPRRYTYALSRGPLQDAAGANAIWNITNVTRSDRRSHYLDAHTANGKKSSWARASAKDAEVQAGFEAYIAKIDPNKEHKAWHEGSIEDRIYAYLTATDLPVEMTDQEYIDVMVWHRGLAVPAARITDNNYETVKRGKELFEEIGCAYCHRPSWTTGSDVVRDPAGFFKGSELPRFAKQTIWPYTDMVQHKLCMEEDIRTGWCRTTPLWGRGLHQKVTGSATADRLHDCRARTTMEAIMWHGNKHSDARKTVEEFRALSKADRDAIVEFLDAI